MEVVIANMEGLERFAAHPLKNQGRTTEALKMHVETLVEVDLWLCRLSSADTVRFLQKCPRLRVLVANKVCGVETAECAADVEGGLLEGA